MIPSEVLAFVSTHWLSLIGAIISFVWVYLELRASILLWPVGIILPLFYIAISWEASFMGNILVNVYYLISSIIGWIMWLQGQGETDKPITHIDSTTLGISLAAAIPLFGVLYWLLVPYSIMPILDTLSTTASFIGMVFLSRKHLEHWICWLIANSTGAVVFFVAEDYVSAFVFVVNLIMSVAGYRHWRQLLIASRHA